MYSNRIKFSRQPFQYDVDTAFFFPGGGRGTIVDDITASLTQGVPLVTLTGTDGSGKTMICRKVEQNLDGACQILFFEQGVESFDEVIEGISANIGIGQGEEPALRNLRLDTIIDRLKEEDRRLIVIIDGAESIFLATLERIRRMVDLANGDTTTIQVLLSGQPLFLLNFKQLGIVTFQDIEERNYSLDPLDAETTQDYLNHCIEIASGSAQDFFSPRMADRIMDTARGNFRLINRLADQYVTTGSLIDPEIRGGEGTAADEPVISVEDDGRIHAPSRLGTVDLDFLKFPRLRYRWYGIAGGIIAVILLLFLMTRGDEDTAENVPQNEPVPDLTLDKVEPDPIEIPQTVERTIPELPRVAPPVEKETVSKVPIEPVEKVVEETSRPVEPAELPEIVERQTTGTQQKTKAESPVPLQKPDSDKTALQGDGAFAAQEKRGGDDRPAQPAPVAAVPESAEPPAELAGTDLRKQQVPENQTPGPVPQQIPAEPVTTVPDQAALRQEGGVPAAEMKPTEITVAPQTGSPGVGTAAADQPKPSTADAVARQENVQADTGGAEAVSEAEAAAPPGVSEPLLLSGDTKKVEKVIDVEDIEIPELTVETKKRRTETAPLDVVTLREERKALPEAEPPAPVPKPEAVAMRTEERPTPESKPEPVAVRTEEKPAPESKPESVTAQSENQPAPVSEPELVSPRTENKPPPAVARIEPEPPGPSEPEKIDTVVLYKPAPQAVPPIRQIDTAAVSQNYRAYYAERVAAGSRWLVGGGKGKYTVQLMVLESNQAEKNLDEMLAQTGYQPIKNQTYILRKAGQPQTVTLYYGEFDNQEEARQAQQRLPRFLQDLNPFTVAVNEAVNKARSSQ
ncbi:MAG: AAA family ATPase [Desulfofustis sp.]|nr:AAA family ATPase [Desulfofustis sp.]